MSGTSIGGYPAGAVLSGSHRKMCGWNNAAVAGVERLSEVTTSLDRRTNSPNSSFLLCPCLISYWRM